MDMQLLQIFSFSSLFICFILVLYSDALFIDSTILVARRETAWAKSKPPRYAIHKFSSNIRYILLRFFPSGENLAPEKLAV